MAERTVRVCDLCLQDPGGIAISSGAVAWRGYKGTIDVCRVHQVALEQATGAPPSLPPAAKRGRKAQEEAQIVAETPPVKRGPGRPRKSAVQEVAATPKKRGRPRKDSSSDTPVKRGPGRPRKDSSSAPPTKRGPGRPRKTEATADTPAKRKPGRPRKADSPAGRRKPKPTAKVTAKKKSVLTPAPATIRAWAVANKVPVSARGAIGASTLSAYYEAHPNITDMKDTAGAKGRKKNSSGNGWDEKPVTGVKEDTGIPEFSSASS